ncbi:MAG: phosphatidate cytidylyltransferase [Actinomycetota bacterium]
MGQPPEERDKDARDEDLFEDLDDFFAPLEDTGWPEGAEGDEGDQGVVPPPVEDPAAETGALEDWDVAIDVPGAEELLAADEGAGAEPDASEVEEAPEEAQAPEPEEVAAEAELAEEAGGEGPLSLDDLRTPPPAYVDLPGPSQEDEGPEPIDAEGEEDQEEAAGEEGPLLPEEVSVTAEDLFEEEEAEPGVVEIPEAAVGAEEAPAAEEAPDPEAIEAAAEHFATGVRDTPDAVERDLLADLEGEDVPETETVTVAPPAPPGPSWQEGAEAMVEEPAAGGPPAGRNLTAAFASGGLLAIAVLALLLIGKGPFAWFVGAVVLLGQAELYAVMRSRRLQPATLLGLVCGAFILAGAYLHGPAAAPFGLVLAMGLTVLWFMAAPVPFRRSTTVNVGATILGTVYVPFLASFALLLLALPGDVGRNAFLVVVGLTVLYDVSAYAVGTLWGNRPLAPTVSPNKSWEGAIGGTLVILIVGLAIVPAIDPFNSSRAVGLALVIALVAPIGDLVESALKRDLGVKDMGTILPGHGGILDRIDAILFAAPAAYYFLLLAF